MAKKPKDRTKVTINSNKQRNRLLLVPLIALIIKVGIIARIQGFDWYAAGGGNPVSGLKILLEKNYVPPHVWYGADGENYLQGLLGLARDGFFSQVRNLHYWPAGYPLLMWPLLLIFKGSFFGFLSFFQSALYAAGCIFFVEEIRKSRLVRFSLPIAIFLSFNPTLAFNTISIGYELPTVALSLISVASMMRHFRNRNTRSLSIESLISSLSYMLASFMQPRLLVMAFAALLIWAAASFRLKVAALFLVISMSIVSIAPLTLALRNREANGFTAVSTNLGVTMGIGAGPTATGGYNGQYNGVSCPAADKAENAAKSDNAKIGCIIRWYISNPRSTLKLSWHKSVYFWSPWVGPAANGTMARNPWALNHPLIERVKTESGVYLALRNSGKPIPWTFFKLVSWIWMLFTLLVMLNGFRTLWKARDLERLLGTVALATVLLNWLSSIATIGDHRFRIPTMGLSLFLQVVGFFSLLIKARSRLVGSATPVNWPGLRWKAERATDNLPS